MNGKPPSLLSRWARARPQTFIVWLVLFYTIWLTFVTVAGYWPTVVNHWPIALSMTFGSYFAGSTPMGGGTVGFPVLVLLFDYPGAMGRNFGLAIQSIGMISASLYIYSAGHPVETRLLKPALLGMLIGMPLGAIVLAPIIADLWIKLLFAIVWASFGIMHLVKLKELVNSHEMHVSYGAWDRRIGLLVGLAGGLVASLTGVGSDMLIYATLVLLYRADLKIAIPTSVVLMALTSVVGISVNILLAAVRPSVYAISPDVFANWLAAAPVVAIGAPLGAWVVNLISRTPTILIVSLLCIAQFVWTILQERVTGWNLVASIIGVLAFNLGFILLHRVGHQGLSSLTSFSSK